MLDLLLSIMYPKRCVGCKKHGSYLCADCFSQISVFNEFVCPMCLKRSVTGETHPSCIKPFALNGLMCGVVYKGVVKRMVYRFKYAPFMSDLRQMMGRIFVESISQNELFIRILSQQPIVIPIPLSKERLKKRGYNHAELLAKTLAKEFHLEIQNNVLIRIKNTKPQFSLNKISRFSNVLDAFVVNKNKISGVKERTIFLVDDVSTSCATIRECAKVLKRAGVKKVYGVTFAREL